MNEFEQAVLDFRAHFGAKRIGRAEVGGRTVWIKQDGPEKRNRWNRLHALARLLPVPMLRPSGAASRTAALADEVDRLRELGSRGVRVPEVLFFGEGAAVLGDCGVPLQKRLKELADPAARLGLLRQASAALGALHRCGVSHGRPFLKDMMLKDGAVHFLDFEERPTRVMSLSDAQARDVWLFLQSAARYCDGGAVRLGDVLETYRAGADPAVLATLAGFARWARPIRALVEHTLMRVVGTDLKRAVTANKALEAAFLGRD